MNYIPWLDELRLRGVIDMATRQTIAHMLRDHQPYVRSNGVGFCNRKIREYPGLYTVFRTKQRLLGKTIT